MELIALVVGTMLFIVVAVVAIAVPVPLVARVRRRRGREARMDGMQRKVR